MIKFAKAIGANTDLLTAQAFIFQSSLAALISGGGDDVFIKIRQTSPIIEEQFFSSEEQPAVKIPKLIETLKQEMPEVENLEILIVFLRGDVLYIYSKGSHKVFLKRDGKISDLISASATEQLISGFFKENDKLLLISSKPLGQWPEENLQNFLNQPMDSFEDEMELYLQQTEGSGPIAAVLIDSQPEPVLVKESLDLKPQEESIIEEAGDQVISKLKNLADGSGDILKKIFPKKEEESFSYQRETKPIFINPVFKNKKNRLFFVITLVIIVAILFTWSYFNKQASQKQAQLTKILSEARDRYNQAQNLKDSDVLGAKQNLDEARKSLDQVFKLDPKNNQALDLKKEIDSGANGILKIIEVSDWPLFLSTDLIKKDFSAKRMSFSLGSVLLLDENQKTLVVIDLEKKTNQILAGSAQLGSAQYFSLNANSVFVYSEDKGVVRVDLSGSKSSQIIKPDSEWGKISDIFGFAGNIYLLDSGKNQIWKYLPTPSVYSNKNPYLKKDTDLVGGNRLKIDYSVWVLKSGEILKFTAGNSDFFSIGGLDKPISSVDSFFVPEDVDSVYILDKFNSRIVVVKKNGQYLSQIHSDKLKNADDFVVDQEGKKLYLLEGNNIYQLNLQ